MSKLVLIDGNAILHRAYHALPPLTTRRGEPINAVYGLVSMLLKVIQDLKPTHIAVAFDRKEPTFRHKKYPKYQAQRPKMDAELSSQFEKARDVITAFGIPIYDKAGYEADDVIGTLANKVKLDVVIMTGDRDILQLVDNKVKVYMPVVGMSQGKLMGIDEVIEKMGVTPASIEDYKALVGDPSDNYPGVPGIGPKTAIGLLEKYKTLDNIYKHLGEMPTRTAQKLKEGRQSSKISKKLASIVKNVPLKFKIEDSANWDVDSDSVLKLFSEYGFRTLTERVKKVGKLLDQEKQMTLLA